MRTKGQVFVQMWEKVHLINYNLGKTFLVEEAENESQLGAGEDGRYYKVSLTNF